MRRILYLGLILGGMGMILLTLTAQPAVDAQAEIPTDAWDLRNFDQPGQITIFDGPAYASQTGKPVELGDFNGNGCGDVAITGHNARGAAGQTRIVFDICEAGWGSILDTEAPQNFPPGVKMLSLLGRSAGDMFGTELYHADFNNDGYDDLLVSAQNNDGPNQQRANGGAAYIIFGGPDLADQPTIDMAAPPPNVLTIYGGGAGDRFGMWVEGGDFDNDGFQDALIGANQADGINDARINAGEAFVIYGMEDMVGTFGSVLDLLDGPLEHLTYIIGPDFDDLFGSTVYGADLNNDDIDDVIVAAALWRGSAGVGGLAQGGGDGPGNARYNTGDTFVIYGGDIRGQIIDLAGAIDETGTPRTDQFTAIYGPEGGDVMGEEIVVGDLNGDGFNDLIVGSLATPGFNNTRIDGGEAWVIYGNERLPGSMVDLAVLGDWLPIYADESDSKGGDTMLAIDLDRDGYDDLVYGMPNGNAVDANGFTRPNSGFLTVIYGDEGRFPTTDGYIDFFSPPADLRFDYMLGADQYDMSAYGFAYGDVDGDGYLDIAMNGMNGDGPDNERTDAGEIYVVSGRHFLGIEPEPEEEAPVAVEATTEPTEAPSPDGPLIAAPPTNTPTQQALIPPPSAVATGATASSGISDPLLGEQLYNESCAGCHGMGGEGIHGIGAQLIGSEYLSLPPDEVLAFIRAGRTGDDPNSKMGRPMPASGGRPDLSDEDHLAIIAYMQTLDD